MSDKSIFLGNMETKISCNSTSNWSSGPMWLQRRSLGKNKPKRVQASHNLVRRLGLEASLSLPEMTSYSRSYFPLDWNQKGTLLAIVRADREHQLLTVLDVFRQREECTVDTGNTWSYDKESVKFMPCSDTQVAVCCQRGGLRLVDILKNESSLVCDCTFMDDIAVHPSEPNLIWSVNSSTGRGGNIICSDIRQPQECARYQYTCNSPVRIAINPLRSEILALGYSFGYALLVDRRAFKSSAPSPCVAHFEPVNTDRDCELKALAFNSNGSELIVGIDGDEVYLLTTNEPWEKYRTFNLSIEPLLSNKSDSTSPCSHSDLRPYSYLTELQKQHPVEMRDELKAFCDDILSRDSTFKGPSNIIDHINKSLEEELIRELYPNQQASSLQDEFTIDYLNVLLDRVKNCPDLYRARAIALRRRAHGGDYYESLRDCCCALALKPLDFRTIRCLSATLIKLEKDEDVGRWLDFVGDINHLLDFVENAIKEFGDDDDLLKSKDVLLGFRKNVTDVDQEAESDSESPNSKRSYSEQSCPNPAHSESFLIMRDARIWLDYSRRYHSTVRNFRCYGVNFFGSKDEFIIGGGGNTIHIWEKNTTNIVKTINEENVGFVLPHPSICMVATSGRSDTVKLWSPLGKESQDVEG